MDAGQHDLPVSRPRQALHLRGHILRLTATNAPSGVGDDAVAAELVAPVLHLDKRPGVLGDLRHVKRLILRLPADIYDLGPFLPVGKKLIEKSYLS